MAKGAIKDTSLEASRTRTWTIILYPDSMPENFRNIIDEEHIQWIESPLHDKDTLPNGELKKAHIHILLMFTGVKSYEQVKQLTDSLNGPIPKICHDARAMVRYFTHMDSPDKAQYSKTDVVGHGGADVEEMFKPSSSERYTRIKQMIAYIKEYNIMEFQDIMDYSVSNEFDTWFPLLCDNSAIIIDKYIKSQRHRALEYKS
jgi:hypothetical protein